MKRFTAFFLLMCMAFTAACAKGEEENKTETDNGVEITDYTGNTVSFTEQPRRVVALSGSFGEIWLNAGGSLVGATEDAVKERGLDLGDDVAIVGTIKTPDLEAVLACEPDFVIMSADTTGHVEAAESLKQADVPYGLFHVEFFEDYLNLLKSFTELTGREDLYKKNGEDVKTQIAEVLSQAPDMSGKTALFLRAYSSGFKAKDSQNMTGAILADFGFENIVDKYDSILEDISLEEIIMADPDYIFVTTMGTESVAIENLDATLTSSPAWKDLTAIKEGRYFILPQALFHYKPNARWGESYRYISDLLAE